MFKLNDMNLRSVCVYTCNLRDNDAHLSSFYTMRWTGESIVTQQSGGTIE